MFKYMFSVVLAVAFGASAFAGNCHVQQVQQVIAQPVVTYVQPVRQQFVEVQYAQPVVQFQNVGHHHNNVQQVVVQRQRQNVQVQKVVVANNHHVQQQVQVQRVVVNNPRVQRSVTKTVVRSR
mgnify:CR=1 FL=1